MCEKGEGKKAHDYVLYTQTFSCSFSLFLFMLILPSRYEFYVAPGENTISYKGLFVPFFCISEFLLHKAKPDLSLVDINNNTALHLACSKVTYT